MKITPLTAWGVVLLCIGNMQALAQAPADSSWFAHPTETVQTVFTDSTVTWDSTEVGQVRLYTQPGSYAWARRDSLAHAAEDAVRNAVELLDLDAFPHGLRVFMLNSRDQMDYFIGHRYKGLALYRDDAALLVCNESIRPYFRHELFHCVSLPVLGNTDTWLREGAAVAADGSCLKYDNPTVAAYLVQSGKAIPLEDLVEHFGDHKDMITYLQSASLFLYLRDTYGMDAIRSLWQGSLLDSEAILGISLPDLEARWRGRMQQTPTPIDEEGWQELLDKGCG